MHVHTHTHVLTSGDVYRRGDRGRSGGRGSGNSGSPLLHGQRRRNIIIILSLDLRQEGAELSIYSNMHKPTNEYIHVHVHVHVESP